ncbi:glycosyltransferase family 1 protein [soil metagenome]
MRVAVHVGQLLQPVPGGIGRYVEHLLRALPGTGVEVVAFAAGPEPATLARHRQRPAYGDLGWPGGALRYEAWHRLRRPALRIPARVVHATSLAVAPAGDRPLVVTGHDLVFLRHPEHLTPRGVAFHRRGLELAHREAAAVVVPTAYGRDELVAEGFDADRVHVAHHGVQAPSPSEGSVLDVASPSGRRVRPPFVLFVGTLEPRKGVADLLAAHAALRASHPELGLVVAGPQGWGSPPNLSAGGVVALGSVDDEGLDALYRAAVALALPSRYEGFGLPVLEAMARGCPVVTSDAGALVEVGGGAATVVPVGDVDALASALDALVVDDHRRHEAAAAGRRRAASFTWAASAAAHKRTYQAVCAVSGAAR